MTAFVERLDASMIEMGAADEASRTLFTMWRRNEGLLEQGTTLNAISPRLILLPPTALENDVPNIGFMGKETLFAKYYPETTTQPTAYPTSLLAQDYKKLISVGYHAAISGEPWYDIIGTGALLGFGRPELIYERIILPFRTKSGYRRLFCLTIERDVAQQRALPDRKHHVLNFPQKLDLGQVSQEALRTI
ncbi:hypothetical protein V6575_11745 [Roseibium sp. H3510]|uniref:PAS domain-containing protein n=1 Tax=Roseibium algae TaxID=3123038 RepID=A0ABU8TKS7_9HYPH